MCNSLKCQNKPEPRADWEWDLLNCVAPLRVTYTDGTKEVIKGVRYKEKASDPDPVKVDGSTVTVETREHCRHDRVITLLNVRRFEFL